MIDTLCLKDASGTEEALKEIFSELWDAWIPAHMEIIQKPVAEYGSRTVILLYDAQGDRRILKLQQEKDRKIHILEKQIQFSEGLRKKGIPVPERFCWNDGNFVKTFLIGNVRMFASVESYLGKDITEVDHEKMREIGCLLGRMHAAALEDGEKLPDGEVSRSILNGTADYMRLFRNMKLDGQTQLIVKKNAELHNALIGKMQAVWKKLPGASVHGDMGIFNNVVRCPSGILGVIDFNRAGYEALLGDFLYTWYSSICRNAWRDKLQSFPMEKLWSAYVCGYLSERSLNRIEESCLEEMARLLHGLFYTKNIIEEAKQSDINKMEEQLELAGDLFRRFCICVPDGKR